MLFSPLSCKNLHPHRFDATFGELRKFGEPVLHIGHLVVGFKIGLIGEDFVEYEMARRFAIFLKEIDQILRIASDKRDKRVAARSSASLPGFARTSATTEYAPCVTWA